MRLKGAPWPPRHGTCRQSEVEGRPENGATSLRQLNFKAILSCNNHPWRLSFDGKIDSVKASPRRARARAGTTMQPKTPGRRCRPPVLLLQSLMVLRTQERGWCGWLPSELGRRVWRAGRGGTGPR